MLRAPHSKSAEGCWVGLRPNNHTVYGWSRYTARKIPWNFHVAIIIGSVSRRGVRKEGTWRTVRDPDQRHGGHGHSWQHEWCFLHQGRYPENFLLISQLEVCQEGGVKKGGTWRTLGFLDWRHGGQGHFWHNEWCLFTPRKTPWKFGVDISIRSVSRVRGQQGGYLEDVDGF